LEDSIWTDPIPTNGQVIQMTFPTNKRQYSCFIPDVVENDSSTTTHKDIQTPAELLKPLEGSCLYRLEGWWTYEFCYGKHLRQFHQEKDKPIRPQDEYFMGFNNELIAAETKDNYYAAQYDGGTVCDINGQQRRSEIRFVCNNERPTSNIMDINEPFSCSYTVAIHTPLLCRHPKFQPKQEIIHTIRCKLLNALTDEEIAEAKILANVPQNSMESKKQQQQQQQQTQQQSQQQSQQQQQQQPVQGVVVNQDGSIFIENAQNLNELIQQIPELATQIKHLSGEFSKALDESKPWNGGINKEDEIEIEQEEEQEIGEKEPEEQDLVKNNEIQNKQQQNQQQQQQQPQQKQEL